MTKPSITTRAGKGSALTWTEGDTNLTNLRDATITVKAGTGGTDVVSDLNGTVTLVAGTNVTLSGDNTAKTVTINASSSTPAVSGLSDVVITSVAANDVLKYNALTSKWVNGTAVLSVTGTSGRVTVDSTAPKAPIIDLATSGVTAGSYTVASITVDSYGRITSASNGSAGGLTISNDTTTNSDHYLTFTTATTGSISSEKVSSSKLIYNPSTGEVYSFAMSTNVFNCTDIISQGNITHSGASKTVSLTGGGAITINPGTAGTINNMSIGQTTAAAGSFTTLSASTTTTSGAANITYSPVSASGAAIQVSAKGTQGGTNYADFLKVTNTATGATNINKTFRVDNAGTIQFINSAYTTNIFNLTDAGDLTTPTITSSGSLTFKYPVEAIYDIGTSGGTIAPNCANGSVQKITLNSALTINAFTSPVAGQSLTLIIYGGTSYTSITSTMKFAGGIKTLTATAGCIDILSIYYDGTNYFASLGKGYA